MDITPTYVLLHTKYIKNRPQTQTGGEIYNFGDELIY